VELRIFIGDESGKDAVTMQRPLRYEHQPPGLPRTLILVAESHGHSHAVATALASRMRTSGHHVDVRDASGGLPGASEYDAVILGADVAVKRDRRLLGDWVASHRQRLKDIPTGLFIVCGPDRGTDARHCVDSFETRLGMRARFAAVFSYGRLRPITVILRAVLLAALHRIDGAIVDRGAGELRALADSMMHELASSRSHA
jgi:menaquinone-dependent protoporphyrinogen IX oxidase